MKKTLGNSAGIVLIVLGFVWFLQGMGILPGSFMSGQVRWAIYGWGAMIAGALLLVWVKRSQRGNKT